MVERKIAFIVPVFNRWDLARPLLDALADSTGDLAGREILVVDDASEAETREAVAGLGAPFRPILNPENLGFAASVNHAIKGETRAETIVLLNSDLALRPGWLDPMLEALETQPDVFCVGNLHFSAKTSALDHAGVVFYQEGYPIHHRDDVDWIRTEPIREFPAVGFACVAFMRSRFLGLGGFDTRYRNGFEDIDLCLRARTRGWKSVVATRSEVGHHIAASPGRHDAEQDNAHHFLVRWQPLTAPLGHDWEERLVRERRPPLPGSEAPNRSSPISPPHRIFVDLARMLPRGGSGGIMVMVKKLIEAIHRQAPGQFRFLLVVQPGCAAETVRFAGEEDEIWALPGEGNGSPAPLPA
ncbi:MAG: glycosyltransferase, partial [Verrucomicrobia bacterium]